MNSDKNILVELNKVGFKQNNKQQQALHKNINTYHDHHGRHDYDHQKYFFL